MIDIEIIRSLFLCILGIIGLYKFVVFTLNRKTIFKALEKINREWKDEYIENEEEEKLIHAAIKFENKLSSIIFANAQLTCLSIFLSGISLYIRNVRSWRYLSRL